MIELTPASLDKLAVAVAERLALRSEQPEPSPYLTIPEAADYLRASRQRVDDLLSTGRLQRIKDGRRTLIARADIEAHLDRDNRP